MLVGIVLPMAAEMGDGATWAGIAALARQAEDGGADSLWAFDHFFYRWPGRAVEGSHEAFTVLAGVAAVTSRVQVGTLVACTSFRSPGLLAKAAATLDLVAPGRVILGVGCGWHEPEYRAFGYPFDHRVGRFEEVVGIVRPLLDGERVTVAGTWHAVDDAQLVPAPSSRVPMIVAASGPRMLEIAARVGDGWQGAWYGLPDARFREERDRWLEARAAATGGAPGSAERADPRAGVHAAVQVHPDRTKSTDTGLALDPAALADGLGAWAAEGVDHVQLWVRPITAANVAIVLEGLQRFGASPA